MFANQVAIETLVKTDSNASEKEKMEILDLLRGEPGLAVKSRSLKDAVISCSDAARILGYKNTRGVYSAIRNGVLRGYYGGPKAQRASGVLVSSLNERFSDDGGRRRR